MKHRRRRRAPRPALIAALALAAAGAGPARAADPSALGAIEAYATMRAAGVTASFTGDDDGDARAWVEWRPAGVGAFARGHDLARLAGARFAGSLFFLAPGTAYDVRVVLDDPDNAAPVTATTVATTRADAPPAPSGAVHWVDAAAGSDANPGSASQPFATIQAGAEAAQPGDVVRVRPGVYRESVVPPRGGVEGAPIWFVADGPGVVLDGAAPSLEAAPWTAAGGAVWWAPFAGESQYVAVGDERLYDYTSLAALETGAAGLPGGFFVDASAQRLYLKLPDGGDPNGRAVHAAVLDRGFLLDTIAHVVVEGFELRYFGGAQSGVAIDVRETRRAWLRGNYAHHMNTGFRVRRALASENVVERNRFRDTRVFGWPWDAVKAHTPEASAIEVTHGRGNVVRWNDVEGSFNGIYVGSFDDSDEAIARDTDVHGNRLREHGDDGLEPEGACLNVRFWHDAIVGVFNGISLSPIEVGPTWLVRNLVATFSEHAFKVNNGPTGWIFVYHTTTVPRADALEAQAMAPSLPFGPFVSRNNLYEGRRYAIEYGQGSLHSGVEFDSDALWTDDPDRFVKWLDVRYADLAALRAGAGIEAHGFQAKPLYANAPAGDFDLVPGHPLLDVAALLPGINTGFVVGTGPDVGAFERGGVDPWVDAPEPCAPLAAAGALATLAGLALHRRPRCARV